MALVVVPVVLPAGLGSQPNGKLPASLLVATPGLGDGPTVTLAKPAARAWRALSAAAASAGHILKATSTNDSYRRYSVQEAVFRDRYVHCANGVVWAGSRWCKRTGVATAAVPGTSNHGYGLAVDIANIDAHLAWVVANCQRFGFSHEIQSEPWHVHYFAGDKVPAAVLAYEGDDMYEQYDRDRVQAALDGVQRLEKALADLAAAVAALKAPTVTVTGGSVALTGTLDLAQ